MMHKKSSIGYILLFRDGIPYRFRRGTFNSGFIFLYYFFKLEKNYPLSGAPAS